MLAGAKTTVAGLLVAAVCCSAAPHRGPDLAARSDGVEPLNEPCYVHDAACDGYPVCCVTRGTCTGQHSGTISSNTAYYKGGCQSLESRTKEWANPQCKQQGECLVQHLEVCKGGKTKAGYMTKVPEATLARFMEDSCENDCPNVNYGHGSAGSGSDSNATTTTTTTVITRVTQEFPLQISDAQAIKNTENFKLMLSRTVASLAGFGSDHSMVTLDAFVPTATFTMTAHLDISNLHSVTPSEAEAALNDVTGAQLKEALAMRIGACSTQSQSRSSRPRPTPRQLGCASRCSSWWLPWPCGRYGPSGMEAS